MANLPKQIIGSFEDIGKQIGSEVVKAPAEIAGKALESLGASTSGPKKMPPVSSPQAGEQKSAPTPLDEFTQAKDAKTKEAIAHRALAYLAGKGKQPEPSVRERLEKEEMEKRKLEEKKAKESEMAPLPKQTGKRKRGDLYGVSGKASMEKSRNVRQD